MSLPPRSICLQIAGAQHRSDFDRGIPRYVVEHTRAIHAAAAESIHSILLNPELPLTGNLDWLLGTGLLRWGSSAPGAHSQPRPSIYHVMCPFGGGASVDVIWPTWARRAGVATVVTLYDLIPLLFPDRYLGDPRLRAEYEARLNLVRHADRVLAISHSTAEDAIERLGIARDRIQVVHAGAGDHFQHMYASVEAAWVALRARFPAIRPGYMLYVGGFEFRKNLEGLIEGYAGLSAEQRDTHQLVITCRLTAEQAELLTDHATRLGLRTGELVLTGYVSDTELGALYRTCMLFVFASLYEGSGLPILEAMSCGAPVAASNTSSLPELLGDTEATFDPADPASIGECLAATIASPATLERLRTRSLDRSRGYTWERVAARSLEAYADVIPPTARRHGRRARIALVTPWPPDQSGVAVYNQRLASELIQLADVDVIVACAADHEAVSSRQLTLIGADRFPAAQTLRQYDRVVYCMGNSRFHGHVFDLLGGHPGVVVMHDVRLTGFYGWLAGRERPADPAGWLADRLRVSYGSRLGSGLTASHAPLWSQQHALGLYMTDEIQSLAQSIFVHSEFGRDVLALEADTARRQSPVDVLPFAMPAAACAPRGASSAAPLIVTLGVVSEVKGMAELISGFALFAASRPSARLVIAGPTDAAERARWGAYAAVHAPESDIEMTGHLSQARYAALIAAADAAVSLRLISNGEASASIADCLAAGLPTLVSDLGWPRELPAGTVSLLRPGATPLELAERLEALVSDVALRRSLSAAGLDHARANSFAAVARAYVRALELD